ncbi:CHASE domain-containing protein [Loktanella sp. TSTF-M6]|uniref:histidine kinase n=1 Tax=Loktanella gaetbuli TaxID=2881335 RepID=A0ABS8BVL1_9RHOB|nr:CHASE domain-containing protein [Loktanella gaetbuli]MCB5199767.1 CHASE domain-containing protein [Loktanella gaetbuli]
MQTSIRQLAIPVTIALTIFTTWLTYDLASKRTATAFESITADSETAILQRLAAVALALDGVAGLLNASDDVTQQDWVDYVNSLDISRNLPAVSGIGLIQPVNRDNLTEFLNAARQDNVGELVIHPIRERSEKMVIRHIEPYEPNAKARGLDIAFEVNRYTAAVNARNHGMTKLTGPLVLVQGGNDQVGFLMLRPRYAVGMPRETLMERRAAFVDWVYAPIFAENLLTGLTAGQDQMFNITIYDSADPDTPIFGQHASEEAAYSRSASLRVFGRQWNIVWASTPQFSQAQGHHVAWLVLAGGAFITLLLIGYVSAITKSEILANRQIISNEDRNRAIVDNAVFGVLVLNQQGRIISANTAAKALLGMNDDTLEGQRLRDLLTTQGLTNDWTFAEATYALHGGQTLYLELQRNTWRAANGEIRHTVILRDVTAQTESAEKLRKTEARWNLALSGADIGVFDVNLVTQTSIVSDTWRRLMEIDSDVPMDQVQHIFKSRIHPDDIDQLEAADRDCIAGLTPRSISEFRVKFDDGTWRYMKSDAVVVERDAEGNALRLIGAQTDIQAQRDLQDALQASEERIRLAQAHAPVSMVIIDGDGSLTDPNGAMASLTGRSRAELSQMQLSDLFGPAEGAEIVRAVINLQGCTEKTYRGEHKITQPNGEIRWGVVKVSWAPDPNARTDLFVMQISDVTQEKEAARIKSEFVATVSHELRTPLTSIKGALGLMAKAGPNAPPRLLDIAQSNVDRLIYLVNDILDLEKIGAGKLDFDIRPQVGVLMAQQAIEQNAPYAERHGVSLRVQDDTRGAMVQADVDRVLQVLTNLLSNACKYAPLGSQVVLGLSRRGSDLRFSVTDLGPGVPDSFRAHIFKPFSQADSSDTRTKGGTGLGLNISRQIVESMGGQIGFDSMPGRTEFWFTCPIADGLAPADIQIVRPKNNVRKRILHLEDDKDFAEILKLSLQDFADVQVVQSLAEVRKAMFDGLFDTVIIDWELKDGDAAEVVDALVDAQPQARFVVLSSHDRQHIDTRISLSLTKSRKCVEQVVMQLRDVA